MEENLTNREARKVKQITTVGGKKKKPKANKKSELRANILSSVKEIIIALIIIAIIIGSLFIYTDRWPPMVIVESNSMMHGDDSRIGVMDTGDMVLVKKVDFKDIKTYVDGTKSKHKTYGTYGEIIAFKKNGGSGTPVIHRALMWVEYNKTGHNNNPELDNYGTFDIPSANYYNVTEVEIIDYGPKKINLYINLNEILLNFKEFDREPHGGFLTKGDNNEQIDQLSSLTDSNDFPIEPIIYDWVIGRAEGELPSLGLIKLYITGETSNRGSTPPTSSVNLLIVSIILIVLLIVILHLTFWRMEKIRRKRREEEEDRRMIPFKDKVSRRLTMKSFRKPRRGISKKPKVVDRNKVLTYLDGLLSVGDENIEPNVQAGNSKTYVISKSTKKSYIKPSSQSKGNIIPIASPVSSPNRPSNLEQTPMAIPITKSAPEPGFTAKITTSNSISLAKPVPKTDMLETMEKSLEMRDDE